MNIRIRYKDLGNSIKAFYFCQSRIKNIVINNRLNEAAQRILCAHELGHAFHSYALRPVHMLNRRYAMNVAETASTFAEMIVADAAVQEATSRDEKIALLEDKIQRSVAFFMNIHARFLFETRFYEERN